VLNLQVNSTPPLRTKMPSGEDRQRRAQLANARWELSQTTIYAPANGTVIALTLRPGAMAVTLPVTPAMNFVEDEQWIIAIYHQNEVRKSSRTRKRKWPSRCIPAGS